MVKVHVTGWLAPEGRIGVATKIDLLLEFEGFSSDFGMVDLIHAVQAAGAGIVEAIDDSVTDAALEHARAARTGEI